MIELSKNIVVQFTYFKIFRYLLSLAYFRVWSLVQSKSLSRSELEFEIIANVRKQLD